MKKMAKKIKKQKRITIPVDSDIHKRIKLESASQGMTIKDFAILAMLKKLNKTKKETNKNEL